jgi:hypothetical protein
MPLHKCKCCVTARVMLTLLSMIALTFPAPAQAVLFDFDSAPLHSSLPINLTVGGITAHLSATGQGYSIQEANVLGFTPAGFSGYILYPNSIYLADLLIRFDQTLTDFSILYAPEEYGCDSSATMRVTAYRSGSFVGTNTRSAGTPGTWPVDTLSCGFAQGFDSVVVHYDHHPISGCTDWGPIFMADNMIVTPGGPATVTQQYAVAVGWNMMSVPLAVPDRRKAILYSTAATPAYAFDQPVGYVVRDTLKYGEGFWLKFSAPENVSITGTIRTRDTVTVHPGWNLIGTISNPVDTSTIVSIPSGLRGSSWYGYGPGSYTAVTQLTPGQGYWIKATTAGQFVLANPLLTARAKVAPR